MIALTQRFTAVGRRETTFGIVEAGDLEACDIVSNFKDMCLAPSTGQSADRALGGYEIF